MKDPSTDIEALKELASMMREPKAEALAGIGEPDEDMAMHWIDRYAAGIDETCQLDRVGDALTPSRAGGGEVGDAMVERALHATVPGGGQVWCWLPSVDAWTPHETARSVMRAALQAVIREKDKVGEWRSMDSAPRDGRHVLLLFKSEDDLPDRAKNFGGLRFVGRHYGRVYEWSFAAPVGMAGLAEEWMAGWQELPAALPGREAGW